MPPELKPLLAIVIGLAIVHAVLKVRARDAGRRNRATVPRQIQPGPRPGGTPAEALESLRRAAERAGN